MDKDFCPECGTEFLSCCHNDLVVTEAQLRSLAYWIKKELLGRGIIGYEEILPFLKTHLPKTLGIVIDKEKR